MNEASRVYSDDYTTGSVQQFLRLNAQPLERRHQWLAAGDHVTAVVLQPEQWRNPGAVGSWRLLYAFWMNFQFFSHFPANSMTRCPLPVPSIALPQTHFRHPSTTTNYPHSIPVF